MPYLLDLVYVLILLAASPWLLVSAVRKGKYREGYREKLLGSVPRRLSGKKCVWLHAVSVGEVNLLAPLLRSIRDRRPDWECVISTTTLTGMALAKKKYAELAVFYCPLDFSWAVSNAMERIRPDVLVLAELELWPNLVRLANLSGARVAVINGRLSQHSFNGYRRIRWFVARLLSRIDLLAVQDETYGRRFLDLGARPETVQVTGSMKYDGAETDRNNPATRRLAALAGFRDDDVVFLAGSTQDPEETIVLETFRKLSPRWAKLRLVIVPRHPDRFGSVAEMLDGSGLSWQRRSELDRSAGENTVRKSTDARILLVDAVGELGAWWGTARIAFVGGSFGDRGGQNMIEPAAYGAAVSFGPNTRNFRDIVAAMLAADAAVVVASAEELNRFVEHCLERPQEATAQGERAREVVLRQLGATDKTLALLEELVGSPRLSGNCDPRAAA